METYRKNPKSKVRVENGVLLYDGYVYRGNSEFIVSRDELPLDNPDHTYNYLKANGITPELYGIFNMRARKAELIDSIVTQEIPVLEEKQELVALY